jgi:hypothetical protein
MKQATKLALEKPGDGNVLPSVTKVAPSERLVFPTLIQIFEYPGARDAFDKLVQCNVKPATLGQLLYKIGVTPDSYLKFHWPNKRGVRLILNRVTRLADAIEKSPPMFVTLDLDGRDRELQSSLVKALRSYAGLLMTQLSSRRANLLSQRTQEIVGLLNHVKLLSGGNHYDEVATLLDATDVAYGRGDREPRWNAVNLAQMRYRWRHWLKQFDPPAPC